VIGGLAVGAHGFPRATKDVDVVPRPGRENARRLFEALTSMEARPVEIGDFRPDELPVQFEADGLQEGGNWALLTRFGRVDVMQWIPGIDGFEQLDRSAITDDVPGVGPVRFAGYEDVVAMKQHAGRPQDLVDLDEMASARSAE